MVQGFVPIREVIILVAGPDISVVIPAYNAESTLKLCLDSLACQTVPATQIILVDDGSADDTALIARKAGLEVISGHTNKGPAHARNLGVEAATGQIILFLDSDVIVPEDLIEKLIGLFQSDAGTIAVQTLYTPLCPASGSVSKYQNLYYYHALARIKEDSVATFATWCAAVRKESFISAGGFNTRIPEPTVEDEELGYEIVDSGGSILLARDIQVTHLACYSLSQFAKRRLRMAKAQAKSGWRSIRKRLLKRYVNLRETGTHHNRWVVLSILLVLLSALSLTGSLACVVVHGCSPLIPLVFSTLFAVLALLCHLEFFRVVEFHLGAGVLPKFMILCLADMAILAWGIIMGSFQYLTGKRY